MEIRNLGNSVKGHVLDVNKRFLERKLRDYDRQLYLKWNPKKNRGYGLWELRRRPSKMLAVPEGEFAGNHYSVLEYVESDLIHHIMDCKYLDYRILTKLQEMDTWGKGDTIAYNDYLAEKKIIAEENKADAEMRYMIRHNKKHFRELQEYVRSGINPAWFFGGKY